MGKSIPGRDVSADGLRGEKWRDVCVRAHACVCYVKYGADVVRNEFVVVVRCLMLGVLSTL